MAGGREGKDSCAGSIAVEFALCATVLVPLFIGTVALGFAMIVYLQSSSVCRSAGSMFVRGTDFVDPKSQRVLGKIAYGLGFADEAGNPVTTADGQGIVILTQLKRIGSAECKSLPKGVDCSNQGRVVIVKQVRVGNARLRSSVFGQPSGLPKADGSYPPFFYLTNSTAVVGGFGMAGSDNDPVAGAPVDLRAGELAYAAETYFVSPSLQKLGSYLNLRGFYHRNYF